MKILIILGIVAIGNCKSFENVLKPVLDAENVQKGKGTHWGLLVAGSYGWSNYRHQADICHAYQILRKNGIPDENIVVMMYDDIANNRENPTKGVIINHPQGKDVYHGVPKDYTGHDVNPKNFLNILQGKKELMVNENGSPIGSGKVINSGPNDNIFVNFVDHGGPGNVAFPHQMLHASKWNKAIKKMHSAAKYKQMVIYLEACESGSMFNRLLPDNINVFVTTASNPSQSSYATYYDHKRKTFLGDLYSVNWMENSDSIKISDETLQQQYAIVKAKTNKSHVEEYGDLSMSKKKVVQFQGNVSLVHPSDVHRIIYPAAEMNAVPSPDVPLAILRHRLADATTPEEEQTIVRELRKLLIERQRIARLFKSVVSTVLEGESSKDIDDVMERQQELTNHDCYDQIVDHFHDHCMNIAENDHTLRYLYTFVNLCEQGQTVETVVGAIDKVCNK